MESSGAPAIKQKDDRTVHNDAAIFTNSGSIWNLESVRLYAAHSVQVQ
jgi:hypothetical protein